MKGRLTRKIRALLLDRRAVSVAISNLVLVATVISLGTVVIVWANSRIFILNTEYADLVDANSARIREDIIFEYIFYNTSGSELLVYLTNFGGSNNVSLANVYLSNDSWYQFSPDVELRFLNDTLTQSLDIQEQGYFKISTSLVATTSYSIRIVSRRGRLFEAIFVV